MGIATFRERNGRAVDTILQLCKVLGESVELDPEGPADELRVSLYNSKLEQYKNRFVGDNIIGIYEPITGTVSNRHLLVRSNGLRIAVEILGSKGKRKPRK